MKKDPHKVLKVPKKASKKAVKDAYRALVLAYHPDRGGDPKDFQEIQDAYDQLNGKPAGGVVESKIVANVTNLFMQILTQIHAKGGDPLREDIVKIMNSMLSQELQKQELQLRRVKEQMKKFEKMLGMFTVKDAENIFEVTIKNQIEAGEVERSKTEEAIEILKGSQEFLKSCDYKFDPMKANVSTSGWIVMTS